MELFLALFSAEMYGLGNEVSSLFVSSYRGLYPLGHLPRDPGNIISGYRDKCPRGYKSRYDERVGYRGRSRGMTRESSTTPGALT